ncbi:MAG: hypothetical protein A2V77_24385 [Anaeromyxobacter sp. RBG_16_69_14]|nr:MAG: hypothetical protein A2V77_24385 [Anaeromyxobacter sp. RBG_16_69_14]
MKTAHPFRGLVFTLALVVLTSPAATSAQAQVRVDMNLPGASLPMFLPVVVVEPGVRVARDFGQEMYLLDGAYWCRQDRAWYRAHHHHPAHRHPRTQWVYVEPRFVPPALGRIPPGPYRHWHEGRWKAERSTWRTARWEPRHERGHHGGRHH